MELLPIHLLLLLMLHLRLLALIILITKVMLLLVVRTFRIRRHDHRCRCANVTGLVEFAISTAKTMFAEEQAGDLGFFRRLWLVHRALKVRLVNCAIATIH